MPHQYHAALQTLQHQKEKDSPEPTDSQNNNIRVSIPNLENPMQKTLRDKSGPTNNIRN